MNTSDLKPATIVANFKALFADKKQFVFECVRLGLAFFYFIWVFIPFFTLRESNNRVIAHFEITDHAGLFAFIWMMAWFLVFFAAAVSLLTNFKKYTKYVFLALGAVEFIYWFITLISYWVNLADLNALNLTLKLTLNIGFWFILLHIGFIAILALLPAPIKKITDMIFDSATKSAAKKNAKIAEEPKEDKPAEPKVEAPVEEVKEEPKVEEPKPEEPKVEEPQAKKTKEAPEPVEPKPEEKPE